jgi:L-malate glycosyltransferase
MPREVSIVQRMLPQYRVPFFDGLRENLAAENIQLRLLHGSNRDDFGQKGDERDLGWAERLPVREIRLPRERVAFWQQAHRATRRSEMVVMEHAGLQLTTYPLLSMRILHPGPRIAFWGHGANLQARRADPLGEAVKQWTSRRAEWWFAYTEGSADRVAAHGFPRERITVVNNTVHVRHLDYSPTREPFTCVYIGALYDLKRVAFLLDASSRLAELIPDFRLVVLGGGTDSQLVQEAAARHHWLDFRGPTFDEEKAVTLASSALTLMPGLVGLAIVDAFAYGCPLVTTDQPFHSPEVEYLRDGVNGLMLPRQSTPSQYAESVATLLQQPDRMDRLRDGCAHSAKELSMTSMIERFAKGVHLALEAP